MKIKFFALKFFKFLSSLKFAVFNLIVLGILSAVGTFLESYSSAELARVLIYHSLWMKLALISLSINVTSVLIDRWPWKKHHISFITAHFGIVIMIIGSWLTQTQGVDGSMRLELNKENRSIILPSKILVVYSSFDGQSMKEMYRSQPQFLIQKPSLKKPYKISLGKDQIEVIDFYPYAEQSFKFQSNSKANGWAVQFLLSGQKTSYSDWIYLNKKSPFVKKSTGPASLILSKGSYVFKEKNELILEPQNNKLMYYKLRSKGKFQKAGEIKKGDMIQTKWMDLTFKLLDFYKAEVVYEFKKKKTQTDQTVSAIKVRYKDMEKWTPLNSFLRFYEKDRVYIVGYMNRILPIGASIQLKKFNIQHYPASDKAKEYESVVEVDEKKQVVISMNEPLKHKGWTFYQSGFEKDEKGQIKASILAVNRDPGRWIKYFGSVLIVIGIFALFYLKRRGQSSLSKKKKK